MNITLSPHLEAAAQRFTDELNAARPKDAQGVFLDPPQTLEQVIAANITAFAQSWHDAQDAADRASLAANERLMALGKAAASQPDKLDAIEAAVTSILQS